MLSAEKAPELAITVGSSDADPISPVKKFLKINKILRSPFTCILKCNLEIGMRNSLHETRPLLEAVMFAVNDNVT